MKHLALFDFDGTITKKDSLVDFIKYASGDFNYYKGLLMLSPMLAAYKLKFISNHSAKEKLIAHFFSGWDIKRFQLIANKYSKEQIDKIIRPKALERIKWHQANGHKIVVVSASIENWLKGWCEKNSLALLGTTLEVENAKLTGKFSSKNCFGIEKVNRIREQYNLDEYTTIYAYGDSKGDTEMLAIANKKHYKPFV